MKSDLASPKLDFEELTTRLRAYIRQRINAGEYTERSLARILRVSQPHLHNVLKGIRRLNVEFSDRLMLKFNVGIMDLITEEEALNYLEINDPDWLTKAAKRKPPRKAGARRQQDRSNWQEPKLGS